MTGKTYHEQKHIREWVKLAIDQFGVTSLRRVSKWVEMKTGEKVSASTVSRLIKEMGQEYKSGEWVKK